MCIILHMQDWENSANPRGLRHRVLAEQPHTLFYLLQSHGRSDHPHPHSTPPPSLASLLFCTLLCSICKLHSTLPFSHTIIITFKKKLIY